MATANFYICDVCGEHVPLGQRFFVATDYTFNGIENVTDGQYVDLCGEHLVAIIKGLCGNGIGRIKSFPMGNKVLEELKLLQKK
jgi:hypothetical protein